MTEARRANMGGEVSDALREERDLLGRVVEETTKLGMSRPDCINSSVLLMPLEKHTEKFKLSIPDDFMHKHIFFTLRDDALYVNLGMKQRFLISMHGIAKMF